jgi:16S rRNA (adenine1518-N6/adenine1519-N6)-dimethyltransferase
VLERIAAQVTKSDPRIIIEIGPGQGALTALLLNAGVPVHAIELDPAMVATLQARFAGQPLLTLHHADVLDTDLAQWGPAHLAGNLPYYITSPILQRIFDARAALGSATLLVQKEVALRLTARPGTRDYGYLSVVAQSWAKVEWIMKVPAGAFRPPPKVESAVVHLELLRDPHPQTEAWLRFAGQAFRQKRKTLRNNLQHLYPAADWENIPEKNLRAEQLDIPALQDLWSRVR